MKNITRVELYQHMLRGKPHCPACNQTLAYVYGDSGADTYVAIKCNRCHNEVLINTATLETTLVVRAI